MTTLFNLITGALAPGAGENRFAGRRLGRESPHERNRLGIARTFQVVRPFIGMTALDRSACPGSRCRSWRRLGAGFRDLYAEHAQSRDRVTSLVTDAYVADDAGDV